MKADRGYENGRGLLERGADYLKRHGLSESLAHAREKRAGAAFDYDAWAHRCQIKPVMAGYQKSLRLRCMPVFHVCVLRPEAEPVSRITASSVFRQTYGRTELSDTMTTQIPDSDMVLFVKNGDLLSEEALFRMALAIQDGADAVYTDADSYQLLPPAPVRHPEDGGEQQERIRFSSPRFLPDYNPDYLRSMNYIGTSLCVRAGILRSFYGECPVPSAFNLNDRAAMYDLVLRCTLRADRQGGVAHVPKVLLHREKGSDPALSPEEREGMRQALERDLLRRQLTGRVLPGLTPDTFYVKYDIQGEPLVSIVIPNKDSVPVLKECLESIVGRTTWKHLEIVIVENNSVLPETEEFYRSLAGREHTEAEPAPEGRTIHDYAHDFDDELIAEGLFRGIPVRVVRYPHEFHFSRIVNAGVRVSRGSYVVLMNNDVTVRTEDWIERLLGQCSRENAAAAGPKLLYPDGRVQSAGIVVGLMGFAGSMMVLESGDDAGYMDRALAVQDMSAVTGACMMVRRSVFRNLGGFSADFPVALNDVDFCLRLTTSGYRVVFDPSVTVFHHESLTRGAEDTKEKRRRFQREKALFRKKWAQVLSAGDPNYNPNLSDRRCDYSQKV